MKIRPNQGIKVGLKWGWCSDETNIIPDVDKRIITSMDNTCIWYIRYFNQGSETFHISIDDFKEKMETRLIKLL